MKFFNAVANGEFVGDGTAHDLVQWIKQYVDVLFPENGIEWWSDNRYTEVDFSPSSRMYGGSKDFHHVACYVHRGANEGNKICASVSLSGGRVRNLTTAKSFGSEEECWEIARAVSNALESILCYHEIPQIVAFANCLPRRFPHERRTSFRDQIVLEFDMHSLAVKSVNGQVFLTQSFADKGKYGSSYVERFRQDWIKVLNGMNANWRENDLRHVMPAVA